MVYMVSNVCFMGYCIKLILYNNHDIWYNITIIWDKDISTISHQNGPYLRIKFEIQIKNLPYHTGDFVPQCCVLSLL